MAIPDYQTLMLPVLKVAAEGETRVPVAADKIAGELGLTLDERAELLPSGRQRILHNRVHWAKFYMSKAGLIDSPKRGVFRASEEGLKLLKASPTTIDVELLKKYPSFASFLKSSNTSSPDSEKPITEVASTSAATPEEQIEAAQNVLHAALKADLLRPFVRGEAQIAHSGEARSTVSPSGKGDARTVAWLLGSGLGLGS